MDDFIKDLPLESISFLSSFIIVTLVTLFVLIITIIQKCSRTRSLLAFPDDSVLTSHQLSPKLSKQMSLKHGKNDTTIINKSSEKNDKFFYEELQITSKRQPILPLFFRFPIFYVLLFAILPIALCLALFNPIKLQREEFIFFKLNFTINFTEKIQIRSLCFVMSNIGFWLGSYFFIWISVAELCCSFASSASEALFKRFPLSFSRVILFQVTLLSSIFFGISLVFSVFSKVLNEENKFNFTLIQNNEAMIEPNKLQFILCLIILSFLEIKVQRGFFIFLSFFQADFTAQWKVFWQTLVLIAFLKVGQLVAELNFFAGTLIIGFFSLFYIIPTVLNFVTNCEYFQVKIEENTVNSIFYEEDKDENRKFQVLDQTVTLKLSLDRKFGEVGQKVRLSILSSTFSSQPCYIYQTKHRQGTNEFDELKDETIIRVGDIQTQQLVGFYALSLKERFSCVYYLCACVNIVQIVLMCCVFRCIDCCTSAPLFRVTSAPAGSLFRVRFSLPQGRPLVELYTSTFANRAFYTDDTGIDSTMCHYVKCLESEDIEKAQFFFYCSNFRSFLGIVVFLLDKDFDFYTSSHRKCEVTFVLSNCKVTKRHLKKLINFIGEVLVKEYNGTKKDKVLTQLPFIKTFLYNRTYLCKKQYGIIPNIKMKTSAGNKIAITTIGTSNLTFYCQNNIKKAINKEKDKYRFVFYECIFEETLYNLPISTLTSDSYIDKHDEKQDNKKRCLHDP